MYYRHAQIKTYLIQTERICGITTNQKTMCSNSNNIEKRKLKYLDDIINQIDTLYKRPTNRRRGLIDGIGSISKILFGTMDANDEKHINEQLELIENNQQITEHAVRNQLKIINDTVAHLDKFERIIDHNEKLMERTITEAMSIEEINEHFRAIDAIITELIKDTENVLEYLTYIRKGKMHPKLMPINNIVNHLKDAAAQLPEGLYFPFKVRTDDWLAIEENTAITAYYDPTTIYTILRLPLISQPTYNVIKVTEFPVPYNKNVYNYIEINNRIIVIDKDKLTYAIMTESELQNCNKIKTQYICKRNAPVHRVDLDAPCEIQIYAQRQHYQNKCNTRQYISNHMLWITLYQEHTWLYSTDIEQAITVQCNGQLENKIIKNTGKITLNGNCKLTTTDTTIETEEKTYESSLETFLPEINITIPRDNNKTKNNVDTLEDIPKHRLELTKLKAKLEVINNDLQNNEQNFYAKKQFIYPMTFSGTIITITIISIVAWIIIKRKNKKRPKVTISDDFEIPRSILRRSESTRF